MRRSFRRSPPAIPTRRPSWSQKKAPHSSQRKMAADAAGSGCQIAERLFQRPEPRLKVPPVIQTFAKERLSHLLGACRTHVAFGSVKFNAIPLKRQLTEFQKAPHL